MLRHRGGTWRSGVRNSLHMLESLERRALLSSVIPASADLHNLQTGPLAKAGNNLANIYFNYRSAQRNRTVRAFDAQPGASVDGPIEVVGNTVGVELVGKGALTHFESEMDSFGFVLQSITPEDNAIAGFLPITMIRQVSQDPDVLHLTPLDAPRANQQGEAPNQADVAMQIAAARSTYGLNGQGVTVGVISDSVNQVGNGLADSIATGDLPNNIKVINDGGPGDSDEGRALLEEIYDLAPDASFVFDTAGESQQSMATAVTALQNAGCNVIIDDIGFADEPFFQPGIIDQAIDKATAAGITYITSAGNSGNSGFEQAASFVPATDGSGDQLINFNAGGSTPQTRMNITVAQSGSLTLEWDDAYDGVTGTVKADLNINLYDSNGNLRYSGADNTFATGTPVQQIPNVAAGTYSVEIVAVNTPTADLPGYYEFNGTATIGTTQYNGLRTTVVGHSAFSDAISVGAVAFYNAPPYSSTTPVPTDSYSAAGPAIEARDINGNLLSSAQTIDVPEVCGTDSNNTSFFGSTGSHDPTSYPQFFGTSAASGNVAGVATLMLQADPTATPQQVLTALESTATPLNGQTAGSYDPSGGYGLVDGVAAVGKLISTGVPTVSITAVSPNPSTSPVNSIDISFSRPVTGFNLSALSLNLASGPNLLTGSQTLTTTDNQNFVLGNLSTVTSTSGTYTLTLTASGSGIIASGSGGKALAIGASTTFQENLPIINPPQTPDGLVVSAISATSVQINFNASSGNAGGYVLERATSSNFKHGLTRINLPAGQTSYIDTGLSAKTAYFYRIEAFNTAGNSSFTRRAASTTLAAGRVIVDDANSSAVTITGGWQSSTTVPGYFGPDYLQDDNTGKGTKSIRFRPTLATSGEYDVYALWTKSSNRATNVPFDIYSSSSDLLKTVRVNEKTGGTGFVLLGEFKLHSGTASFVRIRNTGTKGEVIANALEFVPVVKK